MVTHNEAIRHMADHVIKLRDGEVRHKMCIRDRGLMQVMKGALDSLQGKEIDYSIETPEKQPAAETGSASYNIEAQAAQEIKFAYCTQFLIMLEKPISTRQETEFKEYLESIGDSIVVVADDEIVKVHVHTNDPGLAMQRGLTYGSLTTIIIENMKLERDEKISALKEKEMQSETCLLYTSRCV